MTVEMKTFTIERRKTEAELVEKLHLAQMALEVAKEALVIAKDEKDRAEFAVLEHLLGSGVECTEKVDGIGYAKIGTPKITASCAVGDMDKAIDLFREMKRDRDIKTTVSTSGLASFVRAQLLAGDDVPEFIKHHIVRPVQIVEEER